MPVDLYLEGRGHGSAYPDTGAKQLCRGYKQAAGKKSIEDMRGI